jgi:hypothetical protein
VIFTAAGAFAEQVAPPTCRLVDSCGPEPIRTLGFGFLSALIVAAFVYARAVPLLAAVFLGTFAVARFTEVGTEWWVDAAAVAFAALAAYVTWPRHPAARGLSDRPVTVRGRVRVVSKHPIVRPWWLLGCTVGVVLAAVSVAGYVTSQSREAAADWLLLTGIAGGLALTLGWRALDWSITRRRFLRREQPGRPCSVLPLRFEVIVVPESGDKVLVVPSNIWEEARLERLWANALPDGCQAMLHGTPESGRWLAVEIDGEMIVGREPAWIEERDASLREAVKLARHLADAVPNTYAAEVGEPDNTLPGS